MPDKSKPLLQKSQVSVETTQIIYFQAVLTEPKYKSESPVHCPHVESKARLRLCFATARVAGDRQKFSVIWLAQQTARMLFDERLAAAALGNLSCLKHRCP